MATSVLLIVGDVAYEMNNAAPFFVAEWDGLGLFPVDRLSQRGALQHGDTDMGWRGRPRLFSVTFGLSRACSIQDRMTARRLLFQRIAPRNAALRLRFIFDVAEPTERTYQVDCRALSDASAFDMRDTYGTTYIPVRFKASDPFLYDPELREAVFSLPVLVGGMPVDTPVDTPIGGSRLDATLDIAYAGDAFSYPRIRIAGPISNARVQNLTTGEQLYFLGRTISRGDIVEIDCRYANKSVRDADGNNRIADLSDDSDLATFHLAPSNIGAQTEANQFRVTGGGISAISAVTLQYYDRFGGM